MCRFKLVYLIFHISLCCFNTSYVSVQVLISYKAFNLLACFNTSYVSVQVITSVFLMIVHSSFNTSYVSVQGLPIGIPLEPSILFQYILCVGSSYIVIMQSKTKNRFNTSYVSVQVIVCLSAFRKARVSIHPMCRFKRFEDAFNAALFGFQYILCVGSSNRCASRYTKILLFQYILCVGSSCRFKRATTNLQRVSIHPMCRFKTCELFK